MSLKPLIAGMSQSGAGGGGGGGIGGSTGSTDNAILVADSTGGGTLKAAQGLSAVTGTLTATGSGAVFLKAVSSGSSGAASIIAINDAANTYEMGRWGSAKPAYGVISSGAAYLYGSGTLALTADGGAGEIVFGVGSAIPAVGKMHTSGGFSWGSTTDPGAANMSVAGTITATGGAIYGTYTVGTFPITTYLEAVVTDALAPVQGATVAAGGSAKAKVMYNGSAKIVTAVL